MIEEPTLCDVALPPAEPLGGRCSCGAVTTARVARVAMCGPCAATVLELARASLVFRRGGVGLGRQYGPLRLDYGPTWADLECELCSATWVGPIDEPCAYCAHRIERTLVEQRLLLLHPDLPDPGDRRHEDATSAWALRLANAVAAGVVTEHEARTAIERKK